MTKLTGSLNGKVHTRTLEAIGLALFGGVISGNVMAIEGIIGVVAAAAFATAALLLLPTAEEVALQWRTDRAIHVVESKEPADE